MTTPTTPWNIPLFSVGDTIPSLEGVLNSQSNALNTALNSLQLTSYLQYGTRSAMNAVPGTVVRQHATVNADSTAGNNGDYIWSGSSWVPVPLAGLTPINPSTATGTGVALGANGAVTLTTVSAVQINGIFSSLFDNYRVDVDLPDSTASISATMQLSVGGAPDTTSTNYDAMAIQGIGTTASSAQATANSSWGITPGSAGTNRTMDVSFEFKRPFLTKPTEIIATGVATSTSMTTNSAVGVKLLSHRASTSYDGITLTFSAGAPSGVVRIYGWNNN